MRCSFRRPQPKSKDTIRVTVGRELRRWLLHCMQTKKDVFSIFSLLHTQFAYVCQGRSMRQKVSGSNEPRTYVKGWRRDEPSKKQAATCHHLESRWICSRGWTSSIGINRDSFNQSIFTPSPSSLNCLNNFSHLHREVDGTTKWEQHHPISSPPRYSYLYPHLPLSI